MNFTEAVIKKRIMKVTDRDDIVINPGRGIAYQVDRNVKFAYDDDYFENYVLREGTEIGKELNDQRAKIVEKLCPDGVVLDIGIGAGSFLKRLKNKSYGYDIMPLSVQWLKKRDKFKDISGSLDVDAITFWDSLEHIPEPTILLNRILPGCLVFVSIPIIENILKLKSWKHYKPDEHLWYFVEEGFINWMARHGFKMIADVLSFEIEAGREDIYSFVFRKN